MRKMVAVAGAGAAFLILLLGARAAAAGGDTLPAPAWDLLRGLTWPGAIVAALFSPVGKALAGLLTSVTPAKPGFTCPQGERLTEQMREVTEVLADMAEAMRRSSQVQEQTAATLVQVQQSLAILLDRTPREVAR